MASEKELKEIIIELEMKLVRRTIPYGHCQYAYYSTSKQKDRGCEGMDGDCNKCRSIFYKDMEEDIRKKVEAL